MNLRKFLFPTLSLFFIVFSCKDDDAEEFPTIPLRDRQEVYDENIAEIVSYLETHFFNEEDFDFDNATNPDNDQFTIAFDTISAENGTQDRTPIIDYLNPTDNSYPKLYKKPVSQDGIDYDLYILKIREGEGEVIHPLDKAAIIYNGSTMDGTVFDSQLAIGNGQPFHLTAVGNIRGVVSGFREGITEFKTTTGFTQGTDNSTTFNNHGIGAVFIPSGLGYFASPSSALIPQYASLIFKIKAISRSNTDFDSDGIPSHIENAEGVTITSPLDTDQDASFNFIDSDDDGDGVSTSDEVIKNEYQDSNSAQFMSKEEALAYFENTIEPNNDDEIYISVDAEADGTFTLNTLTIPATMVNGSMLPNYLNSAVTTVLE